MNDELFSFLQEIYETSKLKRKMRESTDSPSQERKRPQKWSCE